MNIVGGIGLFAALANYRKAKQVYADAMERKETLEAAVETYNKDRDSKYDSAQSDEQNQDPNDELQGVLATTVLRIGNLVGTYCRAKITIVLTNTTNNTYMITSADAYARVFGSVVGMSEDNLKITTNLLLQPGEVKEIALGGGIAKIADEVAREQLIDAICAAAGKKLITSCPKLTLNGIETADIVFTWKAATGAGTEKRARYVNKPGTLRYCMEAYYPN